MLDLGDVVELQVVGLLMVISLAPLLIALSPRRYSSIADLWSVAARHDDKGARTVLLLVVAFMLGAATNRLADDLLTSRFEGTARIERSYQALRIRSLAGPDSAQAASLHVAEFRLADQSAYARTWLERHKMLLRVFRGGVVASVLQLLTLAAAQVAVWLSGKRWLVLDLRLAPALVLLTLGLAAAYRSEASLFYQQVCLQYLNIASCWR